MQRRVCVRLNDIAPIPATLREVPEIDAPADETAVNLAQLFQHHYFDSYPAGPPKPDPTRFEYLELITSSSEFQFHGFVDHASVLKRRTISAELGQAFCRYMLHDHFRIIYFAHMSEVLGKATHAAFEGMKIERVESGDVPDYLCARKVTNPLVAEAKGRFSKVSFESAEWNRWRKQFSRVRAVTSHGEARQLKGFTVATSFVSDARASSRRTTTYIEDPVTAGDTPLGADAGAFIGRVIAAVHYARIFSKLGLPLLAGALSHGYALTQDLSFRVPIWTCLTSPFEGRQFVGGFYQTLPGPVPRLDENGWTHPFELGRGHVAFVGLEVETAQTAAGAARGNWSALERLPVMEPVGSWSSEFGWLLDGTVTAPAPFFVPTAFVTL